MKNQIHKVAILGAGKLGITLAQLALKAGHDVYIAGSGNPNKIALTIEVLTPGAKALSAEEAVANADIVILALPLSKFRKLPKQELANKLVLDAMNHWWEVDGEKKGILNTDTTSSQALQEFLESSRIVKALNHIGYHDLHDYHKSRGEPGRKAVAVAGDNENDIRIVEKFIDSLGFDTLYIGNLSEGIRLEPGGKVFGANVDLPELKNLLTKS